jgi:WD40 repeat protein
VLQGEQGRGALGRVIRAYDRRLCRTVAIKVLLRHGMEAEARFLREARITARLQHPGVVPVHEVGRDAKGEPYYAMKLIAGRPLRDLIGEASTLEARLALLPHVLAVADAIAYAHSQGIVHRDLKPANIIVGEFAETIVIDWGLAKDLRAESPEPDTARSRPYRSTGDAAQTALGTILGTPAYMAPEQARGARVDERADVYALGAVLYHVLSGEPPFSGDCKDVLLAHVRTQDPRPLAETVPEASPDLIAIARKAMQWDPGRRYENAAGLAADLRAYLTGKLVAAHSYTASQLAHRWLRAHKLLVAAATLVAAIGLAAVIQIVAERSRAEDARRAAERRADALILTQARSRLATDPTIAMAWLKHFKAKGGDWKDAQAIAADAASRTVARHVLRAHRRGISALQFLPDGDSLLAASNEGSLRLWNSTSGADRELVRDLAYGTDLAVSPEGSTAFFTTRSGELVAQALASGVRKRLTSVADGVVALSASSDREVFVAHVDGTVSLESSAGWQRSITRHDGPPHVLLHPRDNVLVSVSGDAAVWSDILRNTEHRLVASQAHHVAADVNADRIALLRHSGELLLWTPLTGQTRHLLQLEDENRQQFMPTQARWGHYGHVRYCGSHLAAAMGKELRLLAALPPYTPTTSRHFAGRIRALVCAGEELIVSTDEGVLSGLNPHTGHERRLLGHATVALRIAWSQRGARLASGDETPEIRVWLAAPPKARIVSYNNATVFHAAFARNGDWFAAEGNDGTLGIWRTRTGKGRILRVHRDLAFGLVFDPRGQYVATTSWDGTLKLTTPDTGVTTTAVQAKWRLDRICRSSSGDLVAAGGSSGTDVYLWSRITRRARVMPMPAGISHCEFSPDNEHLIVGLVSGAIVVADVHSNQRRLLLGHRASVRSFSFDASGDHLISGDNSGTVLHWSPKIQAEPRGLSRHEAAVLAVLRAPTRNWVATIGDDQRIRILDAKTGQVLRSITGYGWLRCADFSPDGRLLAAGGVDGALRVFELDSGAVKQVALHAAEIASVKFSPDGTTVVTTGWDGRVAAWTRDFTGATPSEPEKFQGHVDATTSAVIESKGDNDESY